MSVAVPHQSLTGTNAITMPRGARFGDFSTNFAMLGAVQRRSDPIRGYKPASGLLRSGVDEVLAQVNPPGVNPAKLTFKAVAGRVVAQVLLM